jgi:hypothetical protein
MCYNKGAIRENTMRPQKGRMSPELWVCCVLVATP